MIDEKDNTAEIVVNYFDEIAKGICPICKGIMTKEQVGRCVYANPCGHRLYQGTIA
jgi:hypothetical protein